MNGPLQRVVICERCKRKIFHHPVQSGKYWFHKDCLK